MRPISVNDQSFELTKIRRDQRRKISAIIQSHSKIPTIAIGLVKDYCKHIESVLAVRFDDEDNPKYIRVITRDTSYEYKLILDEIISAPTLY